MSRFSSFCVQGKYLHSEPENDSATTGPTSSSSETQESEEPIPIEITHGYSRDHRPDLKQFTLDLITSGDGDVPLYLRVGNGNDADQAVFTEVIVEFRASVESSST